MGEAVGLAFNVETGLISASAVLILLGLVARNVIRNIRHPPREKWRLIRTHVDAYMLSLLFSELLHGLGAAMDMRWVHYGLVWCGRYCSVQGAVRNIGSTSVALITLVIALHTFFVVFFRWVPPRNRILPALVIAAIWIFTVVFAVAEALVNPTFYTPTPYWCWISNHIVERLVGQYLFIWLALVVSIVTYVLVFMSLQGICTVDPDAWTHIRFHWSMHTRTTSTEDHTSPGFDARAQAKAMLLYPACYCVLVLPLSLVRWIAYVTPVPFAASVTGIAVFGLSGLVNVLLFSFTRPNLLLMNSKRRAPPNPPTQQSLVLSISRAHVPRAAASASFNKAAEHLDLRMRRIHMVEDDSDNEEDITTVHTSPISTILEHPDEDEQI